LLYRAVGARTMEGADPVEAARSLQPDDLDGDALRTQDIAQAASRVAVLPDVRAALTEFQRRFARSEGGAVLDGRDICTVICPEAEVRLYVTASAEVRARRRFEELSPEDQTMTLDDVLQDVLARDQRDMNRADAPLVAAPGATIIDTSAMDIEEAVEAAAERVAEALNAR